MQPDDGQHRDQRVAQRMVGQGAPPAQPLGARRADIVLASTSSTAERITRARIEACGSASATAGRISASGSARCPGPSRETRRPKTSEG